VSQSAGKIKLEVLSNSNLLGFNPLQ